MADQLHESEETRFAEAVARYNTGEFERSVELFTLLVADDYWLARCFDYLTAAISILKMRETPDSPEWSRLSRIETEVTERNRKLQHGAFESKSISSTSRRRRRGISTRDSAFIELDRRDPIVGPDLEFNAVLELGDAKKEADALHLIERIPHIDVLHEGSVRPDDEFKIRIYLDEEPSREGEIGTGVVAPTGSRIEVMLMTSSHLDFSGSGRARFIFDGSKEAIEVATFNIKVRAKKDWLEGAPSIIAAFFIEGRPCGMVTRQISLAAEEPSDSPPLGKIIIVPHGAPPVDLRVTIYPDPINNDRQFWCTVSTPHLPDFREGKKGYWNLKNTVSETVQGFMARFTADETGADQLVAELNGAGLSLFDASPDIFKEVFWKLVDAGAPLRSIAIVSAEPYFPWELMIPRRFSEGISEERDSPLGVDFNIGRWIDPSVIAPLWKISLSDSYVIAPNYNGDRDLQAAAAEAEMVLSHYKGALIKPASFTQIKQTLLNEARSLIHFICHGESGGVGQTLRLEGADILTATGLIGIKGLGAIMRSKRPVIFLNACEVGRTNPALVGVGGFAPAFIQLGASAVIAPLWSVSDNIAHDIAQEFYRSVRDNPNIPFSQIFSRIRAKAYDEVSGRDTYAAYCFFGDPLASAAT